MGALSKEFLDLQTALAGEYSIEGELGRGGMGVVLLARDVLLDRSVAIKVLAPHLAADPVARERFIREARTAAGLSHPNIVPIHRVGEAAGFVFFVMSHVPGTTLGERIRSRGPLSAADAVRLVREVAWALAYAHGRGIVHRDIKPDNILIEEGTGRALVTDFGIARVGAGGAGSATLTEAGSIIGTAHYMSPEQAMNEPIDGRSDLYSLGVVAYVAVSGRLPFEAGSIPALLLQQVSAAPRPVAQIAPGTPPALAGAIHRCLEKDRDQRFASGEELASSLAPAEARQPLPAPLRAWLAERNPATVFYAVWSGLLGIPIAWNLGQFISYGRSAYLLELVQMALLALAPLAPVVGFHARRARRLFERGYTLEDLRGALDVAAGERGEAAKLDPEPTLGFGEKALRAGMYLTAAGSLVLTFMSDPVRLALELRHVPISFDVFRWVTFSGWMTSLVLFAVVNMKQIPLLPQWLRRSLRGSLRERLWRSRFGAWLADKLGAGKTARPAIAAFQPTELALGGAAQQLFEALPTPYRESLRDLPSVVRSLEERASRYRAELAAIESPGAHEHEKAGLEQRREAVRSRLGKSVAALESIRVELLRLHAAGAGAGISSLTTLLEEAQRVGDDAARLGAAQREVNRLLSPADERSPTPV